MHTSEIDIAYFKKQIKQKMKHTYLHEFIEKPTIDEEKLFILNSMMDRAILSPEQKEQYIISTMLVQMALDTHDLVPVNNTSDTQPESQISKQLTVLAGDYYSGLYYFLLSEIDDFAMIHTLATAIKEINEYKMNLYYQDKWKTTDDIMFTIKKIETLLFSHVSAHLGLDPLDETVGEWLLINKITLEQKRAQIKKSSSLIDVWRSHCNHDHETCFQNLLEKMMDKQMNHLKASVTSQTSQQGTYLIKELLYKFKPLDVEEG